MTRQISATEAEATILALLDEVAGGEDIESTKRGKVVARLVPAPGVHALRGLVAGVAMAADHKDGLLSTGETWEHD